MNNEIIPFVWNTETESYQIRVFIDDNGNPLFVGKDVATALGYANTTQVVRIHCDDAKQLNDIGCYGIAPQQNQVLSGLDPQTKIITEADMYSLILGSKLASAKMFKRWVVSEVLPTIRKTGKFNIIENEEPPVNANQSFISEVNDGQLSILDVTRLVESNSILLNRLSEIIYNDDDRIISFNFEKPENTQDVQQYTISVPVNNEKTLPTLDKDEYYMVSVLCKYFHVKNARVMNELIQKCELQLKIPNKHWVPIEKGITMIKRKSYVNKDSSETFTLMWKAGALYYAILKWLKTASDEDIEWFYTNVDFEEFAKVEKVLDCDTVIH